MSHASLVTPIGTLHVTADGDVLTAIAIGTGPQRDGDGPLLGEATAQIAAWFAGRLTEFDLPLAAATTPRGALHREAIAAIGYGDTASYGAIARSIGSGPRAVGQACRRNPFPIVIPCHRVVGAGGTPGYYSAGDGLATKGWLLAFEERTKLRWVA